MRPLVLILFPLPLAAHLLSISTGDLAVEGNRVNYELRMPLYEVEYLKDPENALFEQFSLASGGVPGRLLQRTCREDFADGAFVCQAAYEFPGPVEELAVKCTFYAATVPNHIHILRARRGETTDQKIFDLASREAEIDFVPPTPFELALAQIGAGVMRVVGAAAPLLFLAALVLAARTRRELLLLVGMFLAGKTASALLLPLTSWQPAPRFIEAAAALTIAYLAVEILLLPDAGQRWLVVGVLGVFHGLYIGHFIGGSGYAAAYVLVGVALAEIALAAAFALAFFRLARMLAALRPVPVSAGLLLVVGMAWFFVRLRG
jgi:hypothetical protein